MALLPLVSSFREVPIQTVVASAANPSANLIFYVPVGIKEATTVLRVWWGNGSTANGNVNLGLYNSAGTKQWETGSTAQSGTGALQFVDIADQALSAGLYYLALQHSNTTGTFVRQNPTLFYLQAAGCVQEAAASFALPATATFATYANAYLPSFGLDLRGAV